MKSLAFLIIFLQICLAYSEEVCNESCDKNQLNISNNADESYKFFITTSIIYDLTNIVPDIDFESNRCREELTLIKEGIRKKELWAFKLLDASAKPASGFMLGNNFWLGSRNQCNYVSRKLDIDISDRFERNMKSNLFDGIAPFEAEMKFAYVKHFSPWQVEFRIMTEKTLHLGLCLPKSCSNNQIHRLIQKHFDGTEVQHERLTPKVLEVKDLKLSGSFFMKKSFVILLALITAVTVLSKLASNLKSTKKRDENNNIALGIEHKIKLTFTEEFINCFNYRQNIDSMKSRESSKSSLNSVAGMRTISCFLIVISHVCTFLHFTLANKASYQDGQDSILGLVMMNCALLVDCFFVISGYLAASNLLKDVSRVHEIKANNFSQNALLYGRMLLHRYIRLTPVFVLSMVLSELSSSLLNEISIYQQYVRDDLTCPQYWWRNLLYIQNLFSDDAMCVKWSWSLGCDMQFFALTTMVLMVYIRNQQVGEKILKSSLVIFTVISYSIHVYHDFSLRLDVMTDLLSEVYMVSWVRICPYLMGTLTSIYLQKNGGCLAVSQKQQSNLWRSCWLILAVIMLGSTCRNASTLMASLIKVAAHLEVAFVACWVIVAENSGYINHFVKFLSKRIFIRYGKTTYAMYLIGPIVTVLIYGIANNNSGYESPEIIIMCYVILKITGQLSFLVTVHFDVPFCNLSRHVFPKTATAAVEKTK